MSNKLNIGVLGYGNIGAAVVALISRNNKIIKRKSGVDLKVLAIADPKTKKKHPRLVKNADEIINNPEIDIVVEAIGGTKPALAYILEALRNGKHVVTSNKEVIALHGKEILKVAKENLVSVRFEAAVGGGVPILQALRESLNANNVSEVYGIVNGTTNYILSKMTQEGMKFSQALAMAQEKGYAEANPKNDVEGYDAAYKSVILTLMAFGLQVDFKNVTFEGIRHITQEDIAYAKKIGYVIKLLATAKNTKGQVEVSVHPTLVPEKHPLAAVSGPMNAFYVKGDAVGELMFYGQGAGGPATASAVVNDIIMVWNTMPTYVDKYEKAKVKSLDQVENRYYLRLQVADRWGVLAKIAKTFASKKVSVDAVIQLETSRDVATLVILFHQTVERNFMAAISAIKKLSVTKKVCNIIRII